VNIGAYYIVGAPIALLLGFGLKLNAKGLWMGTLTGSVLNVIILAVVTVLTDWQKEVNNFTFSCEFSISLSFSCFLFFLAKLHF
jgi:Na+-driven multidrug efflux pump